MTRIVALYDAAMHGCAHAAPTVVLPTEHEHAVLQGFDSYRPFFIETLCDSSCANAGQAGIRGGSLLICNPHKSNAHVR